MALFSESPLGQGFEAGGILAAFAGVRLGAEAVHGDGQGLVGLARDRAVAHRARLEAANDRLDWLHLVDRERMAVVRLEIHQAAQRAQALGLIVDELRVLLEPRIAAAPSAVLELGDRKRIEEMILAVDPVLEAAAGCRVACGRSAAWEDRPGPGASSLLGR